MKNITELMKKYPRTPHLEGSNLQEGDDEKERIPLKKVEGEHVVFEEKVDAANSGVSFSDDAELLLQSRGHFLVGGARERHFDLFKVWANQRVDELFEILGTRYIMYGEWMRAKHTVFYDALPDLFLEFDIWDKENEVFLSTPARRNLLDGSSIKSVPVLYSGPMPGKLKDLTSFVGPSQFKTDNWKDNLRKVCERRGLDYEKTLSETDSSNLMEGLYVKFEDEHTTPGRAKWVRHGFLQIILSNQSHWLDRPIVPNLVVDDPLIHTRRPRP